MIYTLYQRLLDLLSGAEPDRALAQQVQFLKVENEILRSKLPRRLRLTERERNRLVVYGRLVGAAIGQLISIVTPRTFQRWLNAGAEETAQRPADRPGRPRTAQDVRDLVLRLARDNGWGHTRIHGELKKLGVTAISRTTVANILRDAGTDTGPERARGTWRQFIARHAATLWACDFFTKKVWTPRGLIDYYVVFFLHIASRRVLVTGMTPHPDARWMAQQARNFILLSGGRDQAPTHLIHDFDAKFTGQFDDILAAEQVETVRVGPAAPNLNAHAERWVLSIKSECLDHFVAFGEGHLRYLVDEYLAHYLEERPHQGVGNVPLADSAVASERVGEITCRERLGGLLKHYQRHAA